MIKRFSSLTALVGISAILSACVSTAPVEIRPKVRQSVVTAPADLQLTCSAAAARKFGVRRTDILPVDSEAVSPQIFRVDVQFDGGTARCVINRDAQILELVRV